jgi:hypothetical protein
MKQKFSENFFAKKIQRQKIEISKVFIPIFCFDCLSATCLK